MAASSSSAPTAAAAAAAEAKDQPALSVLSKRLRALRKKYNRITLMELTLAAGKTLNCDQEKLLRSKPVVAALIEELEGLRGQESIIVVSPQVPEAAEESLGVEGHKLCDGHCDCASKSPPSQDDVGEEPSTQIQVCRCVPSGERRVQLFRVHTNFVASTINIYDWCQGQTIYVYNNHQEVGKDLVLIGPRRPIEAFGVITIEAFPLESGCAGRIVEFWDPYDSDDDDNEPKMCVHETDRGSSGMIEVTYLFIPNAVEAEIRAELFADPEVFGAYGSGVVSGTIKAWTIDYGRHCVRLFNNTEKCLIPCPHVLTLPLKPNVVCLPHRPHLELYIAVDLMIEYGQQKVFRMISNLKFTHRDFGRLAEGVHDHRIEVSVWMNPRPE